MLCFFVDVRNAEIWNKGVIGIADVNGKIFFDFDEQTLEYPYRIYREKIKEKLESE